MRPSIRRGGFTLIEVLVVLAIVATLLLLAMPRYSQSVRHAQERVLVENLRVTRDAIDKYFADRRRYPASLLELVENGYLKTQPFDPIADSYQAWLLIAPKQGFDGQVADIKSGAEGSTHEGRPLSEL